MNLLDLLLDLHDGDDRCGCLRKIISMSEQLDDKQVLEALELCLKEHPSGSVYRSLDRSLERSHGHTDGRTDAEGSKQKPRDDALVTRTRKAPTGPKKRVTPNG